MKIFKYLVIVLVVVAIVVFVFNAFKPEAPVVPVNEVVIGNVNLAVGIPHTIQWNPYDIVSDTVTINLIKKNVSGGSNSYEFVKVIAKSTLNDGIESWSPVTSDINSNLFIQVSCNTSKEACQSTMVKSPLSVISNESIVTATILNAVR